MNARYRPVLASQFRRIPQLSRLGDSLLGEMEIVARVLPFKANQYVLDELIDWSRAPNDPIFQLIFPHREMLPAEDFSRLERLVRDHATADTIAAAVSGIRLSLNPHPADQRGVNVPRLAGVRLEGLQHKYRETVLFFPKSGQTCHAYCAFCFRWPQFVDEPDMRIALPDAQQLVDYLEAHNEVTDLLVTGGDPLTMSSRRLSQYLAVFSTGKLEHVRNIRIGTKALSFWPHRFVSDDDADDLLRLFERLVQAGRHVAVMVHINHPVELSTPAVQTAVARIRATGAELRSQSPVLRYVNDDPEVWSRLWCEQVRLGIHPYYMFVTRDTGARSRFDLPLQRAYEIYRQAVADVSGLARTARGPSMSTNAGKIEIQGVAQVGGERAFVLSFIQARDPAWVRRPFFARFDPTACWIDELRPLGGGGRFFFEEGAWSDEPQPLEAPATFFCDDGG